jgi:hypothetical protein
MTAPFISRTGRKDATPSALQSVTSILVPCMTEIIARLLCLQRDKQPLKQLQHPGKRSGQSSHMHRHKLPTVANPAVAETTMLRTSRPISGPSRSRPIWAWTGTPDLISGICLIILGSFRSIRAPATLVPRLRSQASLRWSPSSPKVVGQSWLVWWISIHHPVPAASRGDIVASQN